MKKFLSLVVAALLSVSVATSVSAAKFTDVDASNEALTDAVELLSALNVTKGTTETTFGTAENVTRQQMAAFIYRMMKAGKSVEGGQNSTTFTDLDDATYYYMISWANSMGIIKGRSETVFDPKGGIILQDAYTMMVRALGYDDGTLTYPVEYISLAEDLGLDEDLPSTLSYTDTLTRGDVAIILANMFYADTAETTIEYVPNIIEVCSEHKNNKNGCPDDCPNESTIVNVGSTPKEVHMTLAETVFDATRTTVRVTATPNYTLDSDSVSDVDVDFIYLKSLSDGFDSKEVEFSELGLAGKADDYFLSDITMFVREGKNGEEYFGAVASGSKDVISFQDVTFGKFTSGDNKNKFNGKLTLGSTVTYLYDAPYSYHKGNTDYAPEYIELKGEKAYKTVDIENGFANWTDSGKKLYEAFNGGLGEIEAIDCNEDGKYDYIFAKPYSVGVISTTANKKVSDTYEADGAAPTIYTAKSVVEGATFADKDVVLAYVNKVGNYVKVAEVLTAKEATLSTYVKDNYVILSTGEKITISSAAKVVTNGNKSLKYITDKSFSTADFKNNNAYYFTKAGTLVYVKSIAGETSYVYDKDWVIVLDGVKDTSYTLEDGKLVESTYIDIYNDGKVKAVKVNKDTDYTAYVSKLVTAATDKDGITSFTALADDKTDFTVLQGTSETAEYREIGVSAKLYQMNGYIYKLDEVTAEGAAKDDATDALNGVTIKPYTKIFVKTTVDSKPVIIEYGYDNLPDIKEGTTFKNVTYVLANDKNSKAYENLAVFYGEIEGAFTGNAAEIRVVLKKVSTTTMTAEGTKTVYKYDVLNPFTGKKETGIEGIDDTPVSDIGLGDIAALTKDGLLDHDLGTAGVVRDWKNTVAKLGAVYNVNKTFEQYVADKKAGSPLGTKVISEYNEATGYLILKDEANNIYKITADTVVSLYDMSDGAIKTVEAKTLASKADKNVFLCVETAETAYGKQYYNVKFAMIVEQ